MTQKGFTLIEAVLSTALIGFLLVGILYAIQNVAQTLSLTENTVIASNLARETVERIASLKAENGFSDTLTEINTNSTFDANPVSAFSNFTIDASALRVNADDDSSQDDFLNSDAASNYARVTVEVSWNNGAQSLNLVTLLANY